MWSASQGSESGPGGPPAVSPELGAALLMESSREDKVRRERGEGQQEGRDSGVNHLVALVLGVSWKVCEVEERVPACHAVNGGVLESECV